MTEARWVTATRRTRITGRKALHYVLLFRYNHRLAITPRQRGARALTPGLMHRKRETLQHNKQNH